MIILSVVTQITNRSHKNSNQLYHFFQNKYLLFNTLKQIESITKIANKNSVLQFSLLSNTKKRSDYLIEIVMTYDWHKLKIIQLNLSKQYKAYYLDSRSIFYQKNEQTYAKILSKYLIGIQMKTKTKS